LGYPLDAVLELSDSSGKVLSRVDDVGNGRDAQLSLAIPADGDYELAVSDLHRQGGERYLYCLRAVFAQPDFALSVASDTFTVAAGASLEIPVTVLRAQGFAEPIECTVEGLPSGMTAMPVVSSAEGESAKSVKLVITAGPEPHSGPLRIVGTSQGVAKQAR